MYIRWCQSHRSHFRVLWQTKNLFVFTKHPKSHFENTVILVNGHHTRAAVWHHRAVNNTTQIITNICIHVLCRGNNPLKFMEIVTSCVFTQKLGGYSKRGTYFWGPVIFFYIYLPTKTECMSRSVNSEQ